jgi:hypothetical protein
MDSAGEKKRIRALFCELSLEDQGSAPRFEELWHRAETTTPVSRLSPSLMLLVSAVALVVLFSIAFWARYRSAQPPQVAVSPPQAAEHDKVVVATQRKSPQKFQKRVVRQKKIRRSVEDVTMLSKWQSPTSAFLQFPVNPVLTSLPQLDQSARELESFLPNNDVKETRQ